MRTALDWRWFIDRCRHTGACACAEVEFRRIALEAAKPGRTKAADAFRVRGVS